LVRSRKRIAPVQRRDGRENELRERAKSRDAGLLPVLSPYPPRSTARRADHVEEAEVYLATYNMTVEDILEEEAID